MSDRFAEHFTAYQHQGFCVFDIDPKLTQWVDASLPAAQHAINTPANAHWLRHGGTWFAGVNVLDNDAHGCTPNGINLQGNAANFLSEKLGADLSCLDRAQISVCYPGYPKKSDEESSAAHAYRLRRDAAHIDGLLREDQINPTHNSSQQNASQHRFIREHHHYVLGIPMVNADQGAAPYVVWPESHTVFVEGFSDFLADYAPKDWCNVPITECYQALRRSVFERCERVEIPLMPGQAIVSHRLLLHGTAPWKQGASAHPDGRIIGFFRPTNLSPEQWLSV